MFTVQLSPFTPNHLAPACHARAVNQAELPAGKVLM
jgi:hypothetical protein